MLRELAVTCKEQLGWDERQTFELLCGLSGVSTDSSGQLSKLSQLARRRRVLRALLEQVDDNTVTRVADADQEFATAFITYLSSYGCRALGYEVADPTVAECPTLVLGLIHNQIARGYDPQEDARVLAQCRADALANARAALATRPLADRARFERVLARAEQAYPLREENEPLTVEVPLALMRYAALELGRRLAERGTIEQRDDAFFLELDDARTALRDGGDRRSVIGRRKAERAWVEAHQGPATFGRAPATPPPSMAPFPAEVRFAMEALLWDLEHEEAPAQSQRAQAPGTILNGMAASPGEYTGSARIINSEADFTKLRAGDVLVCPITSPVWSVLFPSIGGLVTDTGGILSQSAIIAREYRVPAVVATGNATKLLRDGQVVAVNGTAGVVDVRS